MMNYVYLVIFSCIAVCAGVQFSPINVYEGYPVVITCTAFMVPNTPETKNLTCIRVLKLQWYNRSERAYSLLAWHRYIQGKPYDSHVFVKRKNWMFKFSSHDIDDQQCNNKGTIKLQLHILAAEIDEAGEYQCQKVFLNSNEVFVKSDTLYIIPYAGKSLLIKLVAVISSAAVFGLIVLALIISCLLKCCRVRRAQTLGKKKSKDLLSPSQAKMKTASLLSRSDSRQKINSLSPMYGHRGSAV